MASFASPFAYIPAEEEAASSDDEVAPEVSAPQGVPAPPAGGEEDDDLEEEEDEEDVDLRSLVMTSMAPAMSLRAGAGAAPVPASSAAPGRPPRPTRRSKRRGGRAREIERRLRRHVHTNVMSVDLSTLGNPVPLQAGAPVRCSNPACRAFLSCVSTVYTQTGDVAFQPTEPTPVGAIPEETTDGPEETTDNASQPSDDEAPPTGTAAAGAAGGGGGFMWACEYCDTRNELSSDFDPASIPRDTAVEWVARPAEAGADGAAGKPRQGLLLFVCDTSGSMCVTKEVQGRVQLRGDRTAELAGLAQAGDGDQWMPGQRRDVTYISRLQALQAAVSAQLTSLTEANPELRVGLFTFSNEVVYVGDGSAEEQRVRGADLHDFDGLVRRGEALVLNAGIKDTARALDEKVFAMSESGPTALGPAVLMAIALAGSQAGSKVVVVTDGLANVGVGSLELEENVATDPAKPDPRLEFYNRVGDLAAARGVAVDIVGIEGEGANLEYVGSISERSGGEVDTVDPLKLAENFSSMLANPVLATRCRLSARTNDTISFVDSLAALPQRRAVGPPIAVTSQAAGGPGGAEPEPGAAADTAFDLVDPVPNQSHFLRTIGNVSADTEVSLEYTQRRPERVPGGGTEAPAATAKSLPFQIQIAYQRLDGAQCVRVLSLEQRVTRDRQQAVANINTPVLASHARTSCAALAQTGQYAESRQAMAMYGELMATNAQTDAQRATVGAWCDEAAELDAGLQRELRQEAAEGVSFASMSATRTMRQQRRTAQDGLSNLMRRQKAKGSTRRYREASSVRAPPVPTAPSGGGAAGAARSRGGIAGMFGRLLGSSAEPAAPAVPALPQAQPQQQQQSQSQAAPPQSQARGPPQAE